jgi:hypothetical protein
VVVAFGTARAINVCAGSARRGRVTIAAITTTAVMTAAVANLHDNHHGDACGSFAMRVRTRATNWGEGSTASIA